MKYYKRFIALALACVMPGAACGMLGLADDDLILMDKYLSVATERIMKDSGFPSGYFMAQVGKEYAFFALLEKYRLQIRDEGLRNYLLDLNFVIVSAVFGRRAGAEFVLRSLREFRDKLFDGLETARLRVKVHMVGGMLSEKEKRVFGLPASFEEFEKLLAELLAEGEMLPNHQITWKQYFNRYLYDDLQKILVDFNGKILDWNNEDDEKIFINDLFMCELRRGEIRNPWLRYLIGTMGMVVMGVKAGRFDEVDMLLRRLEIMDVRRLLFDSLPPEEIDEIVYGTRVFKRAVKAMILKIEKRRNQLSYRDVLEYVRFAADILKEFDGEPYEREKVEKIIGSLNEMSSRITSRLLAPFFSEVLTEVVRFVLSGNEVRAKELLLYFDADTIKEIIRPDILSSKKKRQRRLRKAIDGFAGHALRAIKKDEEKRLMKFKGRVRRSRLDTLLVIHYFRDAGRFVVESFDGPVDPGRIPKQIRKLNRRFVKRIADSTLTDLELTPLQKIRRCLEQDVNELVRLTLQKDRNRTEEKLLNIRKRIWGRDCFDFEEGARIGVDLNMRERIKEVFGSFARTVEVANEKIAEVEKGFFFGYFKKVNEILIRQLRRGKNWQPLDDEQVEGIFDELAERYISRIRDKEMHAFLREEMNEMIRLLLQGKVEQARERFIEIGERSKEFGVFEIFASAASIYRDAFVDLIDLIEEPRLKKHKRSKSIHF